MVEPIYQPKPNYHKTEKDYYDHLISMAETRKTIMNAMGKRGGFSVTDVHDIIRQSLPLRYMTNDDTVVGGIIPYFYQPNSQTWSDSISILMDSVARLLKYCKSDDINRIVKNVYILLTRTRPSIEQNLTNSESDKDMRFYMQIKPLNRPPIYYVLFKNGVYDYKNREFYESDETRHIPDKFKQYGFTSHVPFKYDTKIKSSDKTYQLIDKVMHDWSNDDPNMLNLLCEISASVMMSYGRKRYVILKSNGGDGKSTYIVLNKLLCSTTPVAININEFGNDNFTNQLSMSTQLVYGDDAKAGSMGEKSVQAFKTIVSGQQKQVEVKFLANRIIQTFAVFLQATNDDVKIYEYNDAIGRRLLIVEWVSKNYAEDKSEDVKRISRILDEAIGQSSSRQVSDDFMQTYIRYVLDNSTFSEEYTIWDGIQQATQQSISKSDSVQQFADYCIDNDLLGSHVLQNHYYQMYCLWCQRFNKTIKPVTHIQFGRRFKDILTKSHGYESSNKRYKLTQVNNLQMPKHQISCIFPQLNDSTHDRSSVLINESLEITTDHVNLFKEKRLSEITDVDSLSRMDMSILAYIAKDTPYDDMSAMALSTLGA